MLLRIRITTWVNLSHGLLYLYQTRRRAFLNPLRRNDALQPLPILAQALLERRSRHQRASTVSPRRPENNWRSPWPVDTPYPRVSRHISCLISGRLTQVHSRKDHPLRTLHRALICPHRSGTGLPCPRRRVITTLAHWQDSLCPLLRTATSHSHHLDSITRAPTPLAILPAILPVMT